MIGSLDKLNHEVYDFVDMRCLVAQEVILVRIFLSVIQSSLLYHRLEVEHRQNQHLDLCGLLSA